MTVPKTYARSGETLPQEGMIVREKEPLNLEMPFGSLAGFITPVSRFFVRSHFSIPQPDVGAWRLQIEGEVEAPYELTYTELRAMGSRTIAVTPGWYGMASVKWLTRIIASAQPFNGYY